MLARSKPTVSFDQFAADSTCNDNRVNIPAVLVYV